MFGLNDFVIVIVVNALASKDKKKTNWFDISANIEIAASNTIYKDTTGNPHARSNIQKQAYLSEKIKTVRQAFGKTGTNFKTHTPYRNGTQIGLDDEVSKNQEIVLVKNGLNVREALIISGVHRIIPERTGS